MHIDGSLGHRHHYHLKPFAIITATSTTVVRIFDIIGGEGWSHTPSSSSSSSLTMLTAFDRLLRSSLAPFLRNSGALGRDLKVPGDIETHILGL